MTTQKRLYTTKEFQSETGMSFWDIDEMAESGKVIFDTNSPNGVVYLLDAYFGEVAPLDMEGLTALVQAAIDGVDKRLCILNALNRPFTGCDDRRFHFPVGDATVTAFTKDGQIECLVIRKDGCMDIEARNRDGLLTMHPMPR